MTSPSLEQQLDAQLAALEANPADDAAFRALEELYARHERWDDLVTLLERWARQGGEAAAADLLVRAADVVHRHLGNPARAEALHRQALHADPRHAAALEATVRLAEERGDPAALADALERQADRTADPSAAARLYLRLGKLQEEKLIRRDRACLFFARAVRLDPGLDEARASALRCQLALRRWAAALRTLEAVRARGVGGPGLAAQYARLGAALVDEPLDHALAAQALRAALELAPATPGAREALARLESAPARAEAEADALAAQAARAGERRTAAQLYLRAAALRAAHDRAHPEAAVALAEKAFLLAPGSTHALDLLERHLGAQEAWRALAEVLEGLARSLKDRVALAGLHLRLARLDLERFGDAVLAQDHLGSALAADPACEPAAEQAFELLIEAGRDAEALAVMERHLAASPGRPQHAAWRLQAADIALRLGDRGRARSILEAARRADPRSPRVAAALAPLLEAGGEWRPLADALEAQVQSEAEPLRRAALLERLAEVHLTRLCAPRDAFRRLALALRLDPARPALRHALDEAAARAGLFEELARAYGTAAASDAVPLPARKALLRRAAEVFDRDLGQAEQAIEAWRALVAIAPDDAGARAALEAALLRAGRIEEVAADLRRRAEASPDQGERRELLARLARSHASAGDPERAAAIWREVVEAGDASLESLRGLADALASLGPERAGERLEVLCRLAALLAPAERAQVELERGLVLEGPLGRLGDAAEAYLAVLDAGIPAAEAEAVAGLERLLSREVDPLRLAQALAPAYAARGQPARQAEMLEVLAGRASGSSAGPERARLWLEAAQVREEPLSDPRGALTDAGAALRASPEDRAARAACQRLARAVGAHAELLQLLDEAAGRASAADEERALRLAAADVAAFDLGRPDAAIAGLRRALEVAPGDPGALELLSRVALTAERWDEACDALLARAELASGSDRAALLAQRGELLLRRLGRPGSAATALSEALAGAPAEERPRLLRALATALEAAADRPGAVRALIDLAACAADPDQAAEATRERARLLEAEGDRPGALGLLRELLARRPDDGAAWSAVEAIAASAHPEAGDAADLLWQTAASSRDPRRALAALDRIAAGAAPGVAVVAERRAARVFGEALGQWSLATAALRRAVRAAPGDPEVRAELRAAAARAGADDEAARVYEEVLPGLAGEAVAVAWRELAALREERLGDAEGALRAWAEARRLGGDDRQTVAALARLHRSAGHDRERAEALLSLAAGAPGAEERRAALAEAAEVLEERAGDLPAAAAAWEAVAALRPEDPGADAALDRLHTALDEPAALAKVLERRRAAAAGAPEPALAFRLAELQRTRLASPAAALPLLAEVVAAVPGHAGARTALLELTFAPGAAGAEALALLDRLQERDGDRAGRLLARERRLAVVEEPAERVRLHAEVRALHEQALGQPELALASAARAFVEGGMVAAEAEPELARLAAATGREDLRAEAYEAAAAATGGAEALSLRRRAARVRAGTGGDGATAVAAWSAVLSAEPGDPEALGALVRLHLEMGDAAGLEAAARERAGQAPAGPPRAALLLRLGLDEEALSDAGRAVAAAEDALREDPGCDGALLLLARLHRAAGRQAELARVLRAQADLARDDGARRVELLAERAGLLEGLSLAPEALAAWAELLAESHLEPRALAGLDRLHVLPETREAAGRILEDVYRLRGDARGLIGLLEARAAGAAGAEQRPLLAEVAVLHERLGQPGPAFEALARALAALPPGEDDPALRAALARLAGAAGAHRELAQAYAASLGRGVPPPARRELLLALASLHEERLGEPEQAAAALEELAAGAPEPEALGALVRLHRRQGAHRPLCSALARLAELTALPEGKADLWLEVAHVMEEQLSDREGAADAYRKILAVRPDDPDALRLLGRLLGASERWEELLTVMEREVGVAERRGLVAEAAELRHRLGQLRFTRLSDPAGAIACWREVLTKVPRHPGALESLVAVARGGGTGAAEAALLLEPVYEAEGEHVRLVEVLQARALSQPDPAARAPILRRMAEVQAGPLHSPELAFLTAARAVREDPDQAESIALAARIASADGLEEELASLLAEVADRPRSPPARLELRRRVAALAVRAGDPRRAAEALARVLELAPADGDALLQLTGALREARDADGLAQVLRRRVALEERPQERAELMLELSAVQEELRDPAAAIASVRQALELGPGRRDALARLDRLCLGSERWAELAEVLRREVAAALEVGDAGQAADLRQRLAELQETRLLDREGALALYGEVLAARPDDARALARLEAMLARDPGQSRAAELLERSYAATGAWARYASVLEVRASERPDPVERKALFLELAEVREERLRSPELAFTALCRAFREDPGDAPVRERLSRLAAESGHAEELAALLDEELQRVPAGDAGEVALALGALHEGPLADAAAAVRWYDRAWRADARLAARALPALDRLLRAANRPAELAEVLDAEAGLAKGDERAAFLLRLGQLREEALRDPAGAVRAYEALLAEAPEDGVALRALERLHEAAGDAEALAANLARQRELAADEASRTRLGARLAVTVQALGRDEEAVGLWREVLGADPRHDVALASLEPLLERLARWPELAELLRARLALTADRRESARLQAKLGALLADRLGDPAGAVRAYGAVLDADPRNRPALEALRGLHAAQGDLEGLTAALRRLVPLQEDAPGVKAVRLELASVLLRAGKRGEAAEQGRRAFELAPHGEAELSRLAELFEAAGVPQERVKALEARGAQLSALGRNPEAVEVLCAAAEVWERALGKPEGAAAALEQVLAVEPSRREAWERLRALYARAGDWRAHVRVSDLFVGQLASRAEQVALLDEVAAIHERRLGQREMAFLTSCRAFALDPSDPTASAAVTRLAGETEAWDELAAVYEQVCDEAVGLARARLLVALGQLRDQHLDDLPGAEAAFRQALEVDPASPEALDALTALFMRRGRVKDLVIALEQKLEAAAGLEEKKATLLEMARIYDGQLHDAGEAISALTRLLELDGADEEAIGELATLYRREGRWVELAGILARARDLAPDEATRVAYQLQIAALDENELGDDEAAVGAYRAVLGSDDANREALAGLERLYTKLDRFAELNRVYEREAEIAQDPREKVRILGKSAAIWEEKLGDAQQAILRHEAVLALDASSQAALKGLETLYRREGHWEKLIAVLQRDASLTTDRREQVALLVQAGDVWWKELARVDRAEALFSHALQLDPEARLAVSALARLYERSGNWNLAVELLGREAKLAGGGADAVELQARIGRIEEEMLQDRGAARAAYARALDADPGHVPSLRALRAIAEAERDRELYLRYLLAEARYAEGDAEKARLLHEAGRIHQEERDDAEGAVRFYEEALKRAPDLLAAARPLADLYVARSDWPRAAATLEVVVRLLAGEGEPRELCRQCYRLGYVAGKLGDRGRALACYRRAYELDATYLPALEGLGHLLVEDGGWEEALKVFQAILIHHRDGLTDLEVVETYWQIGQILVKLGQGDRAARSFEKALEIDSGHLPSRRALVEVLTASGEHEAAVEHQQRLLGSLQGEERLAMLLRIGATCRDQLHDPYQAIDAYAAAARQAPGDAGATDALLGLYRETRQSQKAADVLVRLIASPEAQADGGRRARLHHALGLLLRDELGDEAGAARELEAALDADPDLLAAFADLERLLSGAGRWRELEGAYTRMIARLPKGQEASAARLTLWKALGDLYRRVLGDQEGARTAYQVVARASPDDAAAVAAHAELSAQAPGHEAEAEEGYRRLLALEPSPKRALSALIALQAGRRDFDGAYLSAQALTFLAGGATPEEAQVVSRLRRFARDTAEGRLDEAGWAALAHERLQGPLADILTLLAREASGLFVQEPKDLGLHPRKDEVDVEGSMLFLAGLLKAVARALGLPVPRLFRNGEAGARLQVLPLATPALLAGEELFQERPRKELVFSVAKAMTFLRPELTLARHMPHDQLETVVQAAASLGTSRFTVTADRAQVDRLKWRLERTLAEVTRTQRLKLLARAFCDVARPGEVRAFLDAAELTANRAGALLACDLEVVRARVLAERAAVSKLKEEVRLRDLLLFCTSEACARLREQLGLSVVVPA